MKKAILFIVVLLVMCQAVLGANYLLKQLIEEGETQTLTVGASTYNIELVMVSDSEKKAIFNVNGERSDVLSEGESHKFNDGTSILAREILIQEGGDGRDVVQYNIYAGNPTSSRVTTNTASQQAEPQATPEPEPEPVVTAQPAQEYKPVATTADVPEKTEGRQKAKVDTTRVILKKKSWFGRFWDWLKDLF